MLLNEKFLYSNNHIQRGKDQKIKISNRYYFDLSFCNGVFLLGHSSNVFNSAIKDIVKLNLTNSAEPNIYSKQLAKIVKKFFNNDLDFLYFCNTGSESVSKALRIVRSLSGSKKILVCVSGGWHGSSDETLYKHEKNLKPKPISSGLTV